MSTYELPLPQKVWEVEQYPLGFIFLRRIGVNIRIGILTLIRVGM